MGETIDRRIIITSIIDDLNEVTVFHQTLAIVIALVFMKQCNVFWTCVSGDGIPVMFMPRLIIII